MALTDQPPAASGTAQLLGIVLVVIVGGLAALAAMAGGVKIGRRFEPFGRTIGALVMTGGAAMFWSLALFTAAVIAGRHHDASDDAPVGLFRALGWGGLVIMGVVAVAAVGLLAAGNVRTSRRVGRRAGPTDLSRGPRGVG